jgi:hypothetical protein
LLLAGLLMFSTAPVSEILIRTFFESQGHGFIPCGMSSAVLIECRPAMARLDEDQ